MYSLALRAFAAALCVSAFALVGCGSDPNAAPVELGSSVPTPTTPTTSVDEGPQEGEPCTVPGLEASCRIVVTTGNFTSCWPSTRACGDDLKWGPCAKGNK